MPSSYTQINLFKSISHKVHHLYLAYNAPQTGRKPEMVGILFRIMIAILDRRKLDNKYVSYTILLAFVSMKLSRAASYLYHIMGG